MTHVPYNGAGPALNDILGGHVDLFFSGFPAAVPHVKAGNIKLLAVSSAKRSGVAPDVPTVAEASGIKDFDITLWQGFSRRAARRTTSSRSSTRDQQDAAAAGHQGRSCSGRRRRRADLGR